MTDTNEVMIDLETFSTESNALVLSIGAVMFADSSIIAHFHVFIDPADSVKYGLHIDPATVMWWMHPDRDEARKQLMAGMEKAVDLRTALLSFQAWFGPKNLPTWGNGAAFDNVILRNAYKAAGLPCPWDHRHDRCYRTEKNRVSVPEPPFKGTLHNAMDDAAHQARHLFKILRRA